MTYEISSNGVETWVAQARPSQREMAIGYVEALVYPKKRENNWNSKRCPAKAFVFHPDPGMQRTRTPSPRPLSNKYQAWKEAAQFLGVAANAYDDAIHVVPDFPEAGSGEGPPLAKTRPHDMDSFHHVNLGVAHLRGGREASTEIEDMKRAE